MNHLWRLLVLLGCGWGAILSAAAQTAPVNVAVEIWAVPEALWQTTWAGQDKEAQALHEKLAVAVNAGQVEREVAAEIQVPDSGKKVWKQGEEKKFTRNWEPAERPEDPLQPKETETRFIGTVIEASLAKAEDPQAVEIELKISHDLSPSVLLPINYANAATGKDREKFSVAYPRFEKLEWQGRLGLQSQWRLATQIFRPQREGSEAASATRYFIFIQRPGA